MAWINFTPEAFTRSRETLLLLSLRRFGGDARSRVQLLNFICFLKLQLLLLTECLFVLKAKGGLLFTSLVMTVDRMLRSSQSGNLQLQGRRISLNKSLLAITPHFRESTLRSFLPFGIRLSVRDSIIERSVLSFHDSMLRSVASFCDSKNALHLQFDNCFLLFTVQRFSLSVAFRSCDLRRI